MNVTTGAATLVGPVAAETPSTRIFGAAAQGPLTTDGGAAADASVADASTDGAVASDAGNQ